MQQLALNTCQPISWESIESIGTRSEEIRPSCEIIHHNGPYRFGPEILGKGGIGMDIVVILNPAWLGRVN